MWSDEPIVVGESDKLGRSEFARRMAEVIAVSGEASTVYGLIGPWGSGKTSVLNLLKAAMADDWSVTNFTPWAAADINTLFAEFYASLIAAIPKSKRRKPVVKAIKQCARAAVPLAAAVPVVGHVVEQAAGTAVAAWMDDGPWDKRFRDAATQMANLGVRVLVVVDDIDRLQPDEIGPLLKAIRLLGRLPNVHYLLSYDEVSLLETLALAIGTKDPGRTRAFMEKIVQVPIMLPLASQADLDALVSENLSQLQETYSLGLGQQDWDRFGYVYQRALSKTLTTIRSVRRFINLAGVYLPLAGAAEIDLIDLLFLTYLQVTYPQVYARLPEWQPQLLGVDGGPRGHSGAGEGWDVRLTANGVPDNEVETVRWVLTALFPALTHEPADAFTHLAGASLNPNSVSDSDYFLRYFTLGIPRGDVADQDVRAALEADLEGAVELRPSHLAELLDNDGTERSLLVLRKVDVLTANLHADQLLSSVLVAASVLAQLNPVYRSVVGSPHSQALWWLGRDLWRLPQDEDASTLLDALVDRGLSVSLVLDGIYQGRRPQMEEPSPLIDHLRGEIARRSIPDILANFEQRRQADLDQSVVLATAEVLRSAHSDELRQQVANGLRDGRFGIDDVVARFVGIWRALDGTSSRLAVVHSSIIRALVQGEWIESLVDVGGDDVDIDQDDTSWSNRSRHARRVLRRQLVAEDHIEEP